jgi:hypothetical protein
MKFYNVCLKMFINLANFNKNTREVHLRPQVV